VADELGKAILRIEVDDGDAKAKLEALKKQVKEVNGAVGKASRATGGGRGAGGARESVRALEQSQERRFRLAQQINRLEEQGANVSRLRTSLGRLTEAQASRQFEFQRRLSVDLSRQIRLSQARLRTERETASALERQQRASERAGGPRSAIGGSVRDIGSAAFATRGASQGGAALSLNALEQAQQRRFNLSQRINRLEEQGADVTRLRTSLGKVTEAQSGRQFELQRRLSVDLTRQVRLAEARLRTERETTIELQRQQRAAERIGGPRSPVNGRIGLEGSPADTAFRARAGGARLPVRGAVDIVGSPAFKAEGDRQFRLLQAAGRRSERLAERERLREINRGARLGGARQAVGGAVNILGSPAFKAEGQRQLLLLQRAGRRTDERAAQQRRRELETRAKELLSSQDRQTTAATDGFRNRLGGVASSALIGGGFPLLFGQGAGAAAGGLVGGAAGGALGGGFGFALSVVGTAIGAAFDQTLEKGKTLAAGLNDPIGQFDALRQASLLSSGAIERQAAALIAAGREGEAAALIQLDIAKRYGDTGNLEQLRSATDDLNRAFASAGVAIANFAAGPLADFISKLASSTNALVLQGQTDQRVAAAPKAVQAEVAALRQRRSSELAGTGISVADASLEVNKDVNSLLDRRVGKTREVLAAESRLANAEAANLANQRLSYQLIDASVDGYKQQTLEVQKQQLIRSRNDEIFNLPKNRTQADIDAVNQKYATQIYATEKQLLSLKQERLATQFELNAQSAIEQGAIQRQISAAQTLATTEGDRTRSELQRRQQLQEAIAASRDRERSLGAGIDAARLRGGDAGEQEAARLVEQQKAAAETTRLKLIEGADALRQAGKDLSKDLTDAVLKFTEVRSSPEGLNRFLSAADQQTRAENDFQTLLPQFRQAQEQFRGLTGAAAPEFSGSTQDVNAAIRDFITSVKTELDATKAVNDVQRALADNTAALATINAQLLKATGDLAAKQWAVNVAVNADGSSAAYGDVLNRAI